MVCVSKVRTSRPTRDNIVHFQSGHISKGVGESGVGWDRGWVGQRGFV